MTAITSIAERMLLGPWPRRLLVVCALLAACEVALLEYLPGLAVTAQSLWLERFATGTLLAFAGLSSLSFWLISGWQQRLNTTMRGEASTITELRAQVGQLSDQVNNLKVTEQALTTSLTDSEDAIAQLKDQVEQFEALRVELARTQGEAVERDRAKSEFLVRIARELRMPLTAILGLAHTLIHEGNLALAPPDRVEAIYTIRQKGEQLLALVNEVIELSELESGTGCVSLTRCQLSELLNEIQELMQVWVDAKSITFAIECLGQVPETIETDTTRLQRILLNVVGNAVKHTDSGGIRMSVRLARGEKNQPQLQIDVIDTGIGMTQVQRERLFKPFGIVGPDHDLDLHGPGLGLTISRQYALQLGGDLQLIDSGPGLGTRFRLCVDTGNLEGVRLFEFGTPVERATEGEEESAAEGTATYCCDPEEA